MTVTVETYPDTAALVNAAGDRLATAIDAAIAARGAAMIVLTGGGTGIALLTRFHRRNRHLKIKFEFFNSDFDPIMRERTDSDSQH